jgi:hypothetical protein
MSLSAGDLAGQQAGGVRPACWENAPIATPFLPPSRRLMAPSSGLAISPLPPLSEDKPTSGEPAATAAFDPQETLRSD